MPRTYFVYILANRSRTLYVGVTNEIYRRMLEHRTGAIPGFARRYMVRRLVYVESTTDVRAAIAREKQINGWLRAKKIALIEAENPEWADLAETWFDRPDQADGVRAVCHSDPPGEGRDRGPAIGTIRILRLTPQDDKTLDRDDNDPSADASG